MKRATLIVALYSAGYHADQLAFHDLYVDHVVMHPAITGPDANRLFDKGRSAYLTRGTSCTCAACQDGTTEGAHVLLTACIEHIGDLSNASS